MDMVDGDMMGEKWLNQPTPKATHYSYTYIRIPELADIICIEACRFGFLEVGAQVGSADLESSCGSADLQRGVMIVDVSI